MDIKNMLDKDHYECLHNFVPSTQHVLKQIF